LNARKCAPPTAKPLGHLIVLSSKVVNSVLRMQWPQEDHTVCQIGHDKHNIAKRQRRIERAGPQVSVLWIAHGESQIIVTGPSFTKCTCIDA